MGYKVTYPQMGKQKYRQRRKLPKKSILVGASFAFIGAILLWTVWEKGLSWLLPGDPVVTEFALQEMIDRLRDGEGLGQAVVTFCREVVAGAR